MPDFGYVIIRNPGPETRLEYGGMTGEPYGNFASASAAWAAAQAAAAPGDQIHLLTHYAEAEGDGVNQLAAHYSLEDYLRDEGPEPENDES